MSKLNRAQKEAVLHEEGPVLVLAGAGSGKTRVITHRIARLLERGVPPYKIVAVTFTNKAAAEMRERVAKLAGAENTSGLWVATFHSACARILRQSADRVGLTRHFTIYDADDQKKLMTQICKDMGVHKSKVSPRDLLQAIGNLKNRNERPASLDPNDPFDLLLREVWQRYHQRLRRANAVDFGDLLTLALQVITEDRAAGTGWATRWEHVLVDEFQDTNRVQYLLARNLSLHGGNLFAVGDDDQSIYSWRGADVGNILDFESDHPNAKVVKLEQNYRSTGNILEAAFGVIRNNRNRKPKKLWTSSGEGELISYHVAVDERREAAYVAEVARRLHRKSMLGDLAVFYRTHAQSRALEEALRAASVPYRMVAATKFYDRAEIKDLISYLRVLFNPASDIDLQRIINAPKRGIGAATVKRCASIAGSKKVSLYEAVRLAARPQEGILGTGARKKVAAFVSVMEELCELASHSLPSTLAEAVLEKTGYTEALSTRADRESLGRIENLMELVGSIRAYEADADEPSLEEFLERVALTSDADGETGQGAAVTLMTVHAAKGLEFPEVIVTGLEEGVFPHARGLYEEHELEEERRLAYVAFTRAKRKLHLTRTVSRSLMGQVRRNAPARFLLEMGSHLLQHEHQQGAGGSGDLFGSRARSRGQRAPARESHPYLSDEWAAASRSKPSSGHVFGSGKPISGGAKSRRPSSPAKPIRRRRSKSKKKAGAGGWYAGMKVRHKKFGPGTVQAWYGNPPEQKISVYFFNHGVKTIMASYLQIAE